MSKTTLCVITAAGLSLLSIGVMIARYEILGSEVNLPAGPGDWKVTLVIKGQSVGETRLTTATPLDFERQHIFREEYESKQLMEKPPDLRNPGRRRVIWTKRAGVPDGPFRAQYEFYCTVDAQRLVSPVSRTAMIATAPPRPGEYLDPPALKGTDNSEIAELARELTLDTERPADQAAELFKHVKVRIGKEIGSDAKPMSASDCLKTGHGNSGGKSRLLVALLRSRGIPARVVTGLKLARSQNRHAHHWVEAWIDGRWLSMCPYYDHYGPLPSTYLIFGYGDVSIVRGRNVRDLSYSFSVERPPAPLTTIADDPSSARRLLKSLSLWMLKPQEQRLVQFLLLLPIAALMICFFRNIIGLNSFGTFAPALVGLAFRDQHGMRGGLWSYVETSLPGILIFVVILLIGWGMRRLLNFYHLLQVPRVSFMLSFVVVVLIAGIVLANNYQQILPSNYISLFPLVILTGMIERFWTLEAEDSMISSFKTLVSTIVIAATIAIFLSFQPLVNHMFCYPETLGLVMAGQLLIGRYTGFRLTELFRFREFLVQPPVLNIQR